MTRLENARAVDDEMLALLEFQANAIRLKDRRLGAAIVADEMSAHIRQFEQSLKHAMLPSCGPAWRGGKESTPNRSTSRGGTSSTRRPQQALRKT
ncbi:hypothetical protein [Embleya sp. AB8]|uniref:hypothetical protein n=1 Tax=Embleya sp. AB8 TaxID=3156304 RepID=UPI003C78A9D8